MFVGLPNINKTGLTGPLLVTCILTIPSNFALNSCRVIVSCLKLLSLAIKYKLKSMKNIINLRFFLSRPGPYYFKIEVNIGLIYYI